ARLARARRRRALRRRAAWRNLGGREAGRDCRGQRRRFSCRGCVAHSVGQNRLLQPPGAEGPGAAADLLRLRDRRPFRLGGVPDQVQGSGRAVVYLSLGSLGSADVGLMQKLIDTLGETDFFVVVSMGPQHEELRLSPNMTGEEFLPQPAILPQVDVVITHGGN